MYNKLYVTVVSTKRPLMSDHYTPALSRFISTMIVAGILLTAGCTYTLKIKDGRTAYERKQYATAIPLLEKEIRLAKTRSEKSKLAFLLGDSYRKNGQDEAALPWFKMAYDQNYGPEALKAWAYGLKKLERYPEAQEAFKNLGIEIGSPYEFRKELTACTVAADWKKDAEFSGWKIEGAAFCSPQNDFSAALYTGNSLVFTSDRNMAKGAERYKWTNHQFMDLFMVDFDGASPQLFDALLNTPGNEGTACFNKSGTEIFFVRAVSAYPYDDAYCKIYTSEQTEPGAWSDPVPLPFQAEKINYLHPALSADGHTLYFACNDPEGWGAYDLYAVTRDKKTESGWGDPKLLGRSINTAGNELFPSIDGDTLFFASDGLPGMGGLDIFRTYKMDKTSWAPPHNLKSPINSGADDFGYISTGKSTTATGNPGDFLRSGFFTSNRPGGRGGDDIYRFELHVPPPRPPKPEPVKPAELNYRFVLEGYVLEKIYATPDDPNSTVLGRKPLNGAVVNYTLGGKKQQLVVKEDGFFRLELAENTDYYFTATQSGYLANSAKFSTKGIAKDPQNPVQVFEVEIVLDKIYRNREIVLENIYYDYDKWDIRPDAEPTLNRLADMLRQNPTIRIQLGSHTDCRGNEGYNQTLSQRRAQSAVNYLIGKGIDAERLGALGYGESEPAVGCACTRCTEPEHQANRRTTFKVLE